MLKRFLLPVQLAYGDLTGQLARYRFRSPRCCYPKMVCGTSIRHCSLQKPKNPSRWYCKSEHRVQQPLLIRMLETLPSTSSSQPVNSAKLKSRYLRLAGGWQNLRFVINKEVNFVRTIVRTQYNRSDYPSTCRSCISDDRLSAFETGGDSVVDRNIDFELTLDVRFMF